MSDQVWRLVLAAGMVVTTWRLTRLAVSEAWPPVRIIREWIIDRFALVSADGDIIGGKRWGWLGHAIAYVWTCPWCMSPYIGALVWAAADWRLSVPFPWLILAAGSGLSGVMAWVESEHEQRWKLRDAEIERNGRRR